MMADLYQAPKPKKTIKSTEPNASERTTDYSLSAPEVADAPIDVTQSQSKGVETTMDRKGGPGT